MLIWPLWNSQRTASCFTFSSVQWAVQQSYRNDKPIKMPHFTIHNGLYLYSTCICFDICICMCIYQAYIAYQIYALHIKQNHAIKLSICTNHKTKARSAFAIKKSWALWAKVTYRCALVEGLIAKKSGVNNLRVYLQKIPWNTIKYILKCGCIGLDVCSLIL